jgi:hypothetical protein
VNTSTEPARQREYVKELRTGAHQSNPTAASQHGMMLAITIARSEIKIGHPRRYYANKKLKNTFFNALAVLP